jgi:hypothetical protein
VKRAKERATASSTKAGAHAATGQTPRLGELDEDQAAEEIGGYLARLSPEQARDLRSLADRLALLVEGGHGDYLMPAEDPEQRVFSTLISSGPRGGCDHERAAGVLQSVLHKYGADWVQRGPIGVEPPVTPGRLIAANQSIRRPESGGGGIRTLGGP